MASPADPRFLRIPNLPDMQRPRCRPTLPLDFARIRCLRKTRVTNWARPGVFCDGNPLNLSQPIPRTLANLIVRPSPLLWELVEIDQHGLPLDREMRAILCDWFRTKYHSVIPEGLLEPPAAVQPVAPPQNDVADPASAPADPAEPPDLPPADPGAETELPLAAAADPPALPTSAPPPPVLPDNRSRRQKTQGGDHAGLRR